MLLASLIAGILPARRRRRRHRPSPAPHQPNRLLDTESLEPRLALSVVTMTNNEQLLIEMINRARANPQAEVNRVSNISDLNQGLPAGSITNSPKQPLAPHQALVIAAGNHSSDMLNNDYFGHYSPNGDSPSNRANAAGYPSGVAENIAWGGSTGSINQVQHVIARHDTLFVSPGHRLNLMDDSYREIGTGVRYGVFRVDGVNYNASMVTENFGRRSGTVFITGVAYSDAVVDDDFYTVGEGASGIVISATNGTTGTVYSTSTGSSGGYSLQVPDGTYSVIAVGGEIDGQVQYQAIVVSGRNVKVDVVTTEGTPTTDPPPNPGESEPPVPTNGTGLVGRSGSTWWQAKSTGASLVSVQSGNWSNQVQWSDVQTADVDGDGDDDIIGRARNGRWWVSKADANGFTNEAWGFWSPRVKWKNILVGDFNNDGRDDIAGRAPNGKWWVARSTGTEFVNEVWASWSTRINWDFVRVGDFNGDGRDDVAARANNGAWWVAQSSGQSFDSQRWGTWSNAISWKNVSVGDFNADGRDDLIGRAGRTWWVAESTSTSFVNRRWTVWAAGLTWDDIRIGDVDGDGRDDVLARNNGDWWVSRTDTAGVVVNEQWGSWDPFEDWDDVVVIDLDLDGLDDIAGRSGSDWWVARSNGSQFDSSLWGQWPAARPWDSVLSGSFG